MLGPEAGKSAERRPLDAHRPCHRMAVQHFLFQPFAQQAFDLRLEIIGGGKGLEGGLELAFRRLEPALEEYLEMAPLRFDLDALGIVKLNARRLRKPEHIDIREPASPGSVNGAQHLISRAARIGLAIGHGRKIGRQLSAEPATEDRNNDIALRRFRDLRLKGVTRLVEFGLPPNGDQTGDALKFAIEPLRHPFQATALEPRIPRRGHEHANLPVILCHALPRKTAANYQFRAPGRIAEV
jgi:hypothetical protein